VGQGGENVNGIPVFDLVEEALKEVGEVEASVIFVNPYQVLDAALEAIAVGIIQLIIASEDVPPLDLVKLLR
jgi:succinyl-CoA synthetase alpha subunit